MATASERVKASNLRRQETGYTRKDGTPVPPRPINDAQRAWLAEYTERVTANRGAPRAPRATPPPSAPRDTPVTPPYDAPQPAPTTHGSYQVLDFGAPVDSGGSTDLTTHATVCTIKDCPKCKVVSGAQICGVTGEKVWPPIDDTEAQAVAGMFTGAMTVGARYLRSDKAVIIVPIERRNVLAIAIKRFAHRRFNALGAVADILALFVALASTFNYVRSAKPKEIAPDAKP